MRDGHNQSPKFEDIVREQYAHTYRLALRLTRDEHAATDLTQETFRLACERWAQFDCRSHVLTWLYQIVYRKFVDGKRADTRRRRVLHEKLANLATSSLDEHQLAVQTRIDVSYAVDQLEDAEREVIVLRYMQGLSVSETATVTCQPEGTVKWRTQIALKTLRHILKDGET